MLKTLFEMTTIFQKEKIDYCLIGGLAMMLHHGRANTVDMDFYVLVKSLKKVKSILLREKFEVKEYGRDQIKAQKDNVFIDIMYADKYIGKDVVYRAIDKKLGNHLIRVATPEDIIILKTIADRSIDRRDIEELRELFGSNLDQSYIERKMAKIKKSLKN